VSRIWQDVFLIPCFWLSTVGSSSVQQDRAGGRARWFPWNRELLGLETLFWLAWKSVLCE